VQKIQTDAELAELLPAVVETVPAIEVILGKKAEGRPITPEEYTQLSQFVDRVERRTIQIQEEAAREEEERVTAARAEIPVTAFEISIYDAGIKEHILNILTEAEFETVGDLMLAMKVDQDKILGLAGIGPKAIENIEESLAALTFPEPEPEPEPEVEPEAEVETESVAEEIPAGEQVTELEAEVETPAAEEQAELSPQEEVQPEAVVEATAEAPAEEKVKEKKPRKKDEEEISEDDDFVKDDVSLDELFALKEMFQTGRVDEDEDEEESGDKKKKGKKKKKKHVKMVYDEELGEVVARKKHKRGGDEFEEDW